MKTTATLFILGLAILAGCDTGTKKTEKRQPGPPVWVPAGESTADTDRVKATAGVGKQGQGYEEGFVSTPMKAYFTSQQAIALDIQVVQAVNLFKAEHDRFPESQEEFQEKIIKANGIKLPELPDGDKYAYDPATGELMVQQPSKK